MSGTKVRGDVNLNYLYRIKCMPAGLMEYWLHNEDFKYKMSELTLSGVVVDEQIVLNVIRSIYEEKCDYPKQKRGFSLSHAKRAIRYLEDCIAHKAGINNV